MRAHIDNAQQNKSNSAANEATQMQSSSAADVQFGEHRPHAIQLRRLQQRANNSRRVRQLASIQTMINGRFQTFPPAAGGRARPFVREGAISPAKVAGSEVVQRVLTFSGPADELARVRELINTAYRVGLPEGQNAALGFVDEGLDAWDRPKLRVVEAQRPDVDGIGSHLIGKIIEEGDVNMFVGEDRNEAVPTNFDESSAGRPSGARVFLNSGASAIEMIHELIHAYHLGFDPWTEEQKNQHVHMDETREKVSAEEASTVGLGPWADFELTENVFRDRMGLPRRTRYDGWEEPAAND